jgi:hypothetical protein
LENSKIKIEIITNCFSLSPKSNLVLDSEPTDTEYVARKKKKCIEAAKMTEIQVSR